VAYAQREQIRTAASAGRLLVPTRSLPDTMDIPRPFAPALPGHVHALLRLCQDTAEASAEASAQAGEAAAAIRAPSYLLTAARAAAHADRDASTSPPHPAAPEPAVAGHPHERAGAVQDLLHRLGVTSPDLLQRAADIDRASEQLIIEAAGRGNRQKPLSPATPARPASSPALIDGAHASDDPRATSRSHQPASDYQHEAPEAEH